MSLHQEIKTEMVTAMKARDAVRLMVLRGLITGFINELVAKGMRPDGELSDEGVLSVISKAVKQRKDSIEQFDKGGRADLSTAEAEELKILETYLPAQMSKEEIEMYIKEKLSVSPLDPTQKGQFMGIIMKELKGKADGMVVKEVLDSISN